MKCNTKIPKTSKKCGQGINPSIYSFNSRHILKDGIKYADIMSIETDKKDNSIYIIEARIISDNEYLNRQQLTFKLQKQ